MLNNIETTTERVLSLFEEVVDSYANESAKSGSESLTKEEIGNNRERIKERIRHLIRIVFACSDIEKPKDDLPKGTVIFETDLHGDLTAFLCTLLENGMVKFNEANPTGIILYDPIEKKEYKLDELENLKKTNKSEFDNLIERIQILPDITPTETYSQYINCGDFVDRGEQSEQMAYMIPFLSIRYKGKFNDKPLPKLIVGNHENFYLVRRYDVAFGNGADSMFSTNSNTTIFYRINIGLATDSITNRLREM
ncbi:MAG: metallophosphoesterase, partial [Rickettsiales bacterium]|nr:metallophosphoesterase [Rickettsiales bacterium]